MGDLTRLTKYQLLVSEVPSYHSTAPHHEPIPPYSPPTRASTRMNNHSGDESQIQYGLPPIPDTPIHGAANLYNFRVPTWSTHNAPAARQYRSVIERRAAARSTGAGRHHRWASLENGGPSSSSATLPAAPSSTGLDADPGSGTRTPRPLEDPYLVGEEAAAEARRERLRRENGDDILIREDQHWDWLLGKSSFHALFRGETHAKGSRLTRFVSANGELGVPRAKLAEVPPRSCRAHPEAQYPSQRPWQAPRLSRRLARPRCKHTSCDEQLGLVAPSSYDLMFRHLHSLVIFFPLPSFPSLVSHFKLHLSSKMASGSVDLVSRSTERTRNKRKLSFFFIEFIAGV